MKYRKFITIGVLAAATVACQAPAAAPPPSAPSPAAEARQYHYSPFVVQVPHSGMHFDTITFKDVGLHRTDLSPSDPLLEAVAESVAYNLQSAPELAVDYSAVSYDESLVDPGNHLACETHHLYVDLWDGKHEWGYSLWSGCSESDNFAWREVTIPGGIVELSDRVEPLGADIAQTLVQAHAQKCFTKNC